MTRAAVSAVESSLARGEGDLRQWAVTARSPSPLRFRLPLYPWRERKSKSRVVEAELQRRFGSDVDNF
jgi:hypothetical protein